MDGEVRKKKKTKHPKMSTDNGEEVVVKKKKKLKSKIVSSDEDEKSFKRRKQTKNRHKITKSKLISADDYSGTQSRRKSKNRAYDEEIDNGDHPALEDGNEELLEQTNESMGEMDGEAGSNWTTEGDTWSTNDTSRVSFGSDKGESNVSITNVFDDFRDDDDDDDDDDGDGDGGGAADGIKGYSGEANKLDKEDNQTLSEEYLQELEEYVKMSSGRKEHIKFVTLSISNGCMHEVTLPPDEQYVPLKEDIPLIRTYPFELDAFQRKAIVCINNRQSVLVSAHTSSGKTVVAEYSIAMALHNKQRVVYTTPIKALSNQKYREFEHKFAGDVGLITGDVTLNTDASCLIMTTEILRNMLYRGSELMREVGWVIFDEIHYMRDKERGVVWEETLILLPTGMRTVFLSATVPNARQFAEWITFLHSQPCHVIYTEVRPIPLEHYLLPMGDPNMHMVVDKEGNFKQESFNKAMAALGNVAGDEAAGGEASSAAAAARKNSGANAKKDAGKYCCDVITYLIREGYSPVIVFSFSKRECEFYALSMAKRARVTDYVQNGIMEIFNNAIDNLDPQDRELPQILNILSFLKKGIGIHHGGLLPILKEIVEILFAEGLLVCLFATETFAMGLNMPAKTVLFTNCRKFDGKDMRFITSGEYIQMSGRAGRRGLDEKGTVIMMVAESVTPEQVKMITQGKADYLTSAFHLSYNMILNLMRVEEINPEYMLEKSFHQFQNIGTVPEIFAELNRLKTELNQLKIAPDDYVQIERYYAIRERLDRLAADFRAHSTKPEYLSKFLQSGRLFKVRYDGLDRDWAMLLTHRKQWTQDRTHYIDLDVLICLRRAESGIDVPVMEAVTVRNSDVLEISAIKLKFPLDMRLADSKFKVYQMIEEVKNRFKGDLPLINPLDDMKIKEAEFGELIQTIQREEEALASHPMHTHPNLDRLYADFKRTVEIKDAVRGLKVELNRQMCSSFLCELECRKNVLIKMGYCTSSDVVLQKGKVACELSSGQELLLTELIFNGVFSELTPQQIVALLSCLLCDEKSNQQSKLSRELSGPLVKMQRLAKTIARVSTDCQIPLDEDDYLASFKPFLMDACYEWANGSSFLAVCKLTDYFEGSIIRCLRRMEEMLRELIQAARSIGNTELEEKFTKALDAIKRDIVFSPSLYL